MSGLYARGAAVLVVVLVVPVVAAALSACATVPVEQQPTSAPSALGAAPAAPGTSRWTCSDELVPPAGYEQETAFVNDSRTTQEAVDAARTQLLQRLCGVQQATCDGLSSSITSWRTGAGSGQRCAMVVVATADVEAWRAAQSTSTLDRDLRRAVAELLAAAPLRVAVDKISDGGAAGGLRASWLQQRLQVALSTTSARIVEMPATFTGVGVPAGVDVLLGGTLVERRERGVAVVEALFTARRASRDGNTSVRAAAAVVFAAAVAPPAPAVVAPLPVSSPELTVRISSAHAGGLCAGERTQVFLTSTRSRVVRVLGLYGDNEALLMFPGPAHPDGSVAAGEVLPLGGPDGFDVVPVANSTVERFVVVAADTTAGLGAFAALTTTCRLAPDVARAVHAGRGFPAEATVVSDGYRLLPPSSCPSVSPPAPAALQALQDSLSSLPECPR
jgi:hypothetical protein